VTVHNFSPKRPFARSAVVIIIVIDRSPPYNEVRVGNVDGSRTRRRAAGVCSVPTTRYTTRGGHSAADHVTRDKKFPVGNCSPPFPVRARPLETTSSGTIFFTYRSRLKSVAGQWADTCCTVRRLSPSSSRRCCK